MVSHSSILAWIIPWAEEPEDTTECLTHKQSSSLLMCVTAQSGFGEPEIHHVTFSFFNFLFDIVVT